MNCVGLPAFAAALAWLVASAAAAQTPAAPNSPVAPAPQLLAPEVWLIPGSFLPNRQPDGNTVVFRGKQGLVVMDTGRHRWHRQAILDLARSQQAPVVAILNSHWHLDHLSGNPDLKAAFPQAKVYASNAIDDALAGFLKDSAADAREFLKSPDIPAETAEDIRNDLATTENGAALRPDVVVTTSGRVTLGGRLFELHLSRHGPTAADVWLYDPDSRMAAVGDLVTLPVPFLDTACVAGWQAAFAEVWSVPFEILVPGHGQPMTRAEFAAYRAAFGAFAACASSTRDKRDCAAAWVKDALPLIEANGMAPQRAEGMAAYYVGEVLRPNRGNSKFCQAPG